MAKRLVIAVDYDDVLSATMPQLVVDYNKTYDTKIGLEHFYRDLSKEGGVLEAFGVATEQEAIRRLHTIYKRKDYYLNLPLIDGAQAAVERLSRQHELHLVTGRADFLKAPTQQALARDFPGMFVSVEHTNYYKDENDTEAVHRSKGEVCQQIGADVLIDDHVAHGKDVLRAGVQEVLIFGEYPWSAGELMAGMTRCLDWQAVEREVSRLAES